MKEKKSKQEIEQEAGQFYFETVGMFSLIFAVIIFAKLGKVGSFLTMFLKVVFGDWYLLIVILIMIFGFYLILNHHGFNFKNQRFIGYILCLISILILSHFSVHNYVIKEEGSYFNITWNHYKSYMSSLEETYLGGGLLGAILFYIVYSLLGKVGVILVSILILILGFTMIIDKPIIEISKVFLNSFKKINVYKKSFNNFFRYEIGKKKTPIKSIYQSKKKITLKYLDNYKNFNYLESQEQYLEQTNGLIISVFNNLNLMYKLIHKFTSYSSSLIIYNIYDEFDFNILGNKISQLIEEGIYISKIKNTLSIEINNKFISILSLRDLLVKQPLLYNNYLIPVGLNIKNQIEEIDFSKEANLLIIGDYNSGIKSFVSSLIVSSIIKVSSCNIEFNLFDDIGDFNNFHYLFYNINNEDIKEYLNKIVNFIDDRVNELSLKNIHQIDEYNLIMEQEKKDKLNRVIYVIQLDDYNNFYDYKFIDDKLLYITQVGRDIGVYVIFISRNIEKVTTVLYSLFKYKFIFNIGQNKTNLIETKHLDVLINKGDCLFIRNNNEKRIQTAKLTIEEIKKIKQEIN